MYYRIVLLFICCSLGFANAQTKPKKNTPTSTEIKPTPKKKVLFSNLQIINEQCFYKDAPYTGTSFELFEGTNYKMQEIEWVNGYLDGTKTEWFKGGSIVRARIRFKAGKRNGISENYYKNGLPKLFAKYIDDVLDSTLTAFYPNGNMQYSFTYTNGEKTGPTVLYFDNGNIEQKVNLVNGYPEGIMETYYEAGNIRMKTTYKNGIKDGQYIRYHLTGIVAEESYFKNGIQDSISMYWDNVFGTKLKQENYKLGKKEGLWVTYNELGDTLTLYNYKDNIMHGSFKKYYCGDIEIGDKNNGKQEKYDRSKSIKKYIYALDEYGTYNNGKLDGEFKTGLFNRANHAEGTYSNGIRIGEWRYYNDKDNLVLYEKYNDDGELIEQKPKLQPLKGDK